LPQIHTVFQALPSDFSNQSAGGGNISFAGTYAQSEPEKTSTSPDPFRTLPNELINMVLFQLMPKDITNIRLVSRSFHQLPGYLFIHLIKRHMPWFWEADKLDDWVEAFRSKISGSDIRGRTANINWVQIYQYMLVLQGSTLGVRGRARIHKFVEEFADRIRRLQIEDPSGNYHFPGKSNRPEWTGVGAAYFLQRPLMWCIHGSAQNVCKTKFQVTRTGKLGLDEIGDVWPISVQI
jgi:hypothetical protein